VITAFIAYFAGICILHISVHILHETSANFKQEFCAVNWCSGKSVCNWSINSSFIVKC